MTAVYISPSLEAMRLGGLALMSGMTMFGGALDAPPSLMLPPELAGVVILLVAIGNGMVTTAPCWQKVHKAADARPGRSRRSRFRSPAR
jgi:putative effector of murein hydrolase LrgA (UPF0299 family)